MKSKNILPFVNKPGRYIGREYNLPMQVSSEGNVSCALVFPDLYEIGMSHQGLQILYHILAEKEYVRVERGYCPDIDAEKILRVKNLPLTTLESGSPLAAFDIIGITLPHELCYTNILTIFDRSSIPFLSEQRTEDHPLIIGGGACSFNPEPVAPFFDAILLGDGEDAIVDITKAVYQAKKEQLGREETLLKLSEIEGIYIPAFYNVSYQDNGNIASITPDPRVLPTVSKRLVRNLDDLDHLRKPLVPNSRIVHDRLGIEVARGCTRGCRFCQAGITYRPVRERSVEQILDLADSGITNSGFEELALQSLSTGDYSCLPDLLPVLMDRYSHRYVSVALPSMRVGTLTERLMDEIKRVRKTGFTLAPEAGSERLRQAMNKGISEEDLLESAQAAFSLGWNLIKLYFMIGLPTESEEDIESIADLVKKTAEAGSVSGKGRKRVTVSIGTFVPKPHTSLQWDKQIDIEESHRRIKLIKKLLPSRSIKIKYHDPRQSYLEGIFSRGDRRLASLVIAAWRKGARLDSWSDHFNLELWQQSALEEGLELDFYLRQRLIEEILPWEHLTTNVLREFLIEERSHVESGTYTPDCRYHSCHKCGVCDFKTIQPIVHNRKKESIDFSVDPTFPEEPSVSRSEKFKYLVSYSRTGSICYLGHLDFLQIIFRALRRAQIKTCFSQGYNPSPKVSFGPALPVGTQSLCEFFLMELPEPLTDRETICARLDSSFPEGITVLDIEPHSGPLPQNITNTYSIILPQPLSPKQTGTILSFMRSDNYEITRTRKGKTKQIDIRPLISDLDIESPSLIGLTLISRSGAPGIKPLDLLSELLKWDDDTLARVEIKKLQWEHLEN